MSVASFIAAQRTEHGVPHVLSCRALEVAPSWFYKWRDREPTARQRRRAELDEAVKASFDDSGGTPGTYGSPRVREDLIADGWRVSKNTVAASMARRGLQGRSPKRKRRSLTRPDKAAAPIPDLASRDFTAATIDQRWCGDLTEIPTDEGKLYLATVLDLASTPTFRHQGPGPPGGRRLHRQLQPPAPAQLGGDDGPRRLRAGPGPACPPRPRPGGGGMNPVRDDTATMTCEVCGQPFVRSGRQRWCSTICRHQAWRRQRQAPTPPVPAKATTVYQCLATSGECQG